MEYVWYFPETDTLKVLNQFVHNEYMSVYGVFEWATEAYLGELV